jgi:hypothetical protein
MPFLLFRVNITLGSPKCVVEWLALRNVSVADKLTYEGCIKKLQVLDNEIVTTNDMCFDRGKENKS